MVRSFLRDGVPIRLPNVDLVVLLTWSPPAESRGRRVANVNGRLTAMSQGIVWADVEGERQLDGITDFIGALCDGNGAAHE